MKCSCHRQPRPSTVSVDGDSTFVDISHGALFEMECTEEMIMKLLSRLVVVITLAATTVVAQTKVTPPKNKYTPQQDVQIGREAASEVREQYPLINDSQVRGYIE